MKTGECVWIEGAPWKYENRGGQTEPGWHVLDNEWVKGGEPAPVVFGIGSVLETKNGSLIKVSEPMYSSGRVGAIRVEFSILAGGNADIERGYGFMVCYDQNLKHRSGNHRDANEKLDIVGVFEGKLPSRCPHCGKICDAEDLE